jgi:hypothetical protein
MAKAKMIEVSRKRPTGLGADDLFDYDLEEEFDQADKHDGKRRCEEDERISKEQATALAGERIASAIKRLQKATTVSYGPGLRIQKAQEAKQILAEEKAVDESTLEVMEEGHVYRNCPKAIVVPCSIMSGRLRREFGGLKQHRGVLSCRLRLDFGRYCRPSLMLILRRNKNLKKPLNLKNAGSFYEVTFKWEPGGTAGEGEYQIKDAQFNSFRHEDEAKLVEEKLWEDWDTSEVYRLSDEERERLGLISFTGRCARIESTINRGAFQVDLDRGQLELLEELYRTTETRLNVLFLVPDADERNPRQTSRHSTDFGVHEWQWFDTACVERLQPDHQYMDKDGNLNITLDMRSIKTFQNRMYAVYDKEIVQCQELERSQKVPSPSGLSHWASTRMTSKCTIPASRGIAFPS